MDIKLNTIKLQEDSLKNVCGETIPYATPITYGDFIEKFHNVSVELENNPDRAFCFRDVDSSQNIPTNVLGIISVKKTKGIPWDTLVFEPLKVGEEFLCVPMGADDSLFKHEKDLLSF